MNRGPTEGRAQLTLASLLLASACTYLPEDHGMRSAMGSIGRSMHSIGASFQRVIDRSSTDLVVLTGQVSSLPAQVGERGNGLARSLSAATAGAPAAIAGGIHGVSDSTGLVVGRAGDDLLRLPSPGDVGAQVESGMRGMRAGLRRTPEVLRLDRRPMAESTDPEHETSLTPTHRTSSWLERILRRMGLAH